MDFSYEALRTQSQYNFVSLKLKRSLLGDCYKFLMCVYIEYFLRKFTLIGVSYLSHESLHCLSIVNSCS